MSTEIERRLQHAAEVLVRRRAGLLRRQGVLSVDVGFRWSAGALTDEVVIAVRVAEKLESEELGRRSPLPEELDGVPVDVLDRDPPEQDRFRDPLIGGAAICLARRRSRWGTLALAVYDRTTRRPYYLTNRHVVAGATQRDVWQPPRGPESLPETARTIGRVVRQPLSDRADCALVEPDHRRSFQYGIDGIDTVGTGSAADLGIGSLVLKRGAKSLVTVGKVVNPDKPTVSIKGGGTFRHQILIAGADGKPFSRNHDSGSAVVDMVSKKVVGLLHAVSANGRFSVAAPFDAVSEVLGADLVLGEPEVPSDAAA